MFVLFDIVLLLAGILLLCWILGLVGVSAFEPLGNLIWVLFVAALILALVWMILRLCFVVAGTITIGAPGTGYTAIAQHEIVPGLRTRRHNHLNLKLLFFALCVLCVCVNAQNANIKWSPEAQQQVRDWANGGGSGSGDKWQHTIQRGGLGLAGPNR